VPRGEPSAFTSDEPPRDGRLSNGHTGDGENWADPDMAVLRLHRRPPTPLPIEVFGPWDSWIVQTAEAAACPPDFTAAPLLSTASVLVGHARWAQATPGWAEPPHLWIGSIGDSGDGKSPGADTLMRDVLPEIERRMLAEFPDQLRGWRAAIVWWAENRHRLPVTRSHRTRSGALHLLFRHTSDLRCTDGSAAATYRGRAA
jgi:hypothetical protein